MYNWTIDKRTIYVYTYVYVFLFKIQEKNNVNI